MLLFEPPRHDPATFTNADLGAVGGLIQSLRWFVSRSSLLLYSRGMYQTLETELQKMESRRPLPSDAFYMLRRYFRDGVVLELRALHDRDSRALGSRQIFERIGDTRCARGLA